MRVQAHACTLKAFLLLLVMILWISPVVSSAQDNPTVVSSSQDDSAIINNPERAFGYTIGDVLKQRIALHEDESDAAQTLQQLPVIQREGRWITRQQANVSDDGRWLNISYQIINSPTRVRIITLPALTFETEQGQQINVPPWSFSIAPLTPVEPADETSLPLMQADWKPEAPTSLSLWQNIQLLLACLLLTLFLWGIWWFMRGITDARSLPFARAFRTIRQHKGGDASEATANWLAMHRAFDQLSGKSIGRDSVETLIKNTHWLAPFKSDIQTFYKRSSMRFFANDPSVGTSGNSTQESFDLAEFSRQLYVAEKKHTTHANNSPARLVDAA